MANPTSSGGHPKPGKMLSHYMPSRTVNFPRQTEQERILLDFDPDCRIVSNPNGASNMSEAKWIASVPGHAADSGSSCLASSLVAVEAGRVASDLVQSPLASLPYIPSSITGLEASGGGSSRLVIS
jgi:hypothetical protein